MQRLSVYLLGLPRIELGGVPVRLERHKATALLTYLALTPGQQARDKLASLLWPDQPAERARASLRRALATLTRALPGRWWRADRSSVELLSIESEVWVDVVEFLALCGTAMRAPGNEQQVHLRKAAGLYRDDFLAGFTLPDAPEFDEWQFQQGEALRRALARVLEGLVWAECDRRAYRDAIGSALRLVDLDPLDEAGHCLLMRVYLLAGQRSSALRQYRECERILGRELGVLPGEAKRLQELIRDGRDFLQEEARAFQRSREATKPTAVGADSRKQGDAMKIPVSSIPSQVPLIGRERELALAKAVLHQARDGHGRVLLVSGEPGVGKTRLVHEILGLASDYGLQVFKSACLPEGEDAYRSLSRMTVEALAAGAGGHDLELPAWLLADLKPFSADARRSPRAPAELLTSEPADEHLQVREAFAALVCRLAARRPLLLFIDDIHWADPATLSVLQHLIGRISGLPLVVVGSYRDAEASTHIILNQLLLLLEGQRLGEFLSLSPLPKEKTRDLLAATLQTEDDISPEFLERIHEETQGNPLFILEICKSLLETGKVFKTGGYWRRNDIGELVLPRTVRATILSRIERLPGADQHALRLAAVLGQEFNLALLRAVSELQEQELVEVIERAEAMQIVRLRGRSGSLVLSFAHPLIPFALRESIGPLRLQRLHERVARTLNVDPERHAEALARHLVAAGEQRNAVDHLLRAAHQAMRLFAYETAADHLQRALDLLEGIEENGAVRALVLEQLADVSLYLGKRTESIAHLLAALEAMKTQPECNTEAELRLHRKIVKAHSRLRQLGELQRFSEVAETSISAGLELLDPHDPQPEQVLFLAALANDPWSARAEQDWQSAERYGLQAVEMAEEIGQPELISLALGALATVLGIQLRLRERTDVCRRRLKLSRQGRFKDRYERVAVLCETGAALLAVGEFADSMSCLLEAERLAGEMRAIDAHIYAIRLQAECLYGLDRWDEMLRIEAKRQALEQEYSPERVGRFCYYCGLSASVHAMRGELAEAAARRQEAHDMMVSTMGPLASWPRGALYCRGKALFAAGEHERVGVELSRALESSASWVGDHDLYAMLVENAAVQRDAGLLERYAPEAERTATEVQHSLYQGVASRAWGVLHLLRGEHEEAGSRLEQALAVFRKLGARWQLGRTHAELAEVGKARGEAEESRKHLEEAIKAFDSVGARPYAENASERLLMFANTTQFLPDDKQNSKSS